MFSKKKEGGRDIWGDSIRGENLGREGGYSQRKKKKGRERKDKVWEGRETEECSCMERKGKKIIKIRNM